MGRQINFFFDSEDEKQFLQYAQTHEVVFLKPNYLKQPQVEFYSDFNDPSPNPPYTKTFICLKEVIMKMSFDKREENEFSIDPITNSLIEFIRSRLDFDENLLVSGRIWCEFKYWMKDEYENEILLRKGVELEKLYFNLERWIRRHCKKLPKGYYIGPNALKQFMEGARLSYPLEDLRPDQIT